ncbi:MAG: transcription termination factor NusA [Candidatus Pacebacteria bacterium]|nr:transcription termination factor NusA [Candidatus Paceibacterota bacterium]
MDLKSFSSAIAEIAEERGIPEDKIYDIISEAIASAYKKEYGKKKQKIVAKLEKKTGELLFWQVKQVVIPEMLLSDEEIQELKSRRAESEQRPVSDEELEVGEGEERKIRFNPERHILLEEAVKIEPDIKVGEELKIPLETKEDFGRIAAQTAKQVILQKIREVEKEEAYKEFSDREGEVVSGIVQRVEKSAIFLDIGRASGILPHKEQIFGETYRPGQRLKLFVLKTETTPKGPLVVLSRIYPKLISKLFELEVPEIGAKQVIVRAIAREAGSRSKVAVSAEEEGIDPIGALVGQRGTRINAVINELGGEKIDVILWDEKPEKFLANALSPAKVLEVRVLPKNRAQVIIPDDQLSLAIGKEGQNVRLAAKLTGWKIDVRSLAQFEEDKKEGRVPFGEDEEVAKVETSTEPDAESTETEPEPQ